MQIRKEVLARVATLTMGVAILLACLGCGSRRRTTKEAEVRRDSVRVEVRERTEWKRDTVYIEVPKQTAERIVKDSTSRLETDWAVSLAHVSREGVLSHSLETKAGRRGIEMNIPTKVRDSIVYRDREVVKTEIQEVTKPLSPWQRKQIAGFWVLVSVVVAFSAWKTRKLWIPLIRRFI